VPGPLARHGASEPGACGAHSRNACCLLLHLQAVRSARNGVINRPYRGTVGD
jgi:hypothetical protein